MSASMTRILLLAASSVVLSGCVGGPAGGTGPAPLTPTQRFALQVEPGLERVALAVHEDGVSENQQRAIIDIANRFAVEGAPVITVETPSGDDPVAGDMGWRVKAALEAAGLPSDRVQVATYAAPDPRAPVLVGFETLRAAVPRCGTSWTNLARTGANAGSANFGCAVTANLAAQIENPRDIIQPRGMTPGDQGRRTVVFAHYRQGEPTAAEREELIANDRVSNAVD